MGRPVEQEREQRLLAAVRADRRLAQTLELVGSPGVAWLSLDVFDTLLWRTVPQPAQAFLLLGRRLADAGLLPEGMSPRELARLRARAEVRARERAERDRGSVECRLEEVWQILSPVLGDLDVAAGVELEVGLEREICQVDRGVAALAELAAALPGTSVRLVSDTYLSAGQLRRLLDRPELAGVLSPDTVEIAVSSEYGVGKSGGLFEASLAAAGVDPLTVVHLGDNAVADVHGATEAGARAVHYATGTEALAEVLRAEGVWGAPLGDPQAVDERHGDAGVTALRARAVRRAEGAALVPSLRPFFTAGAGVFGPAFTAFASWVHDRAAAHGATTVLCLMREGELLDGLVRAAAPAAAHPVDSRSLWLSRQVCALASVTSGSREELATFLFRRKPSSVAGLLGQLGVDPELLPAVSPLLAAPLDAPRAAERVLDALDDAPHARAALLTTSRRLRERLWDHLDRELPADGPVVVVDVGWGGTIQALLARLLAERGTPRQVVGLYLVTQAVAESRRLDGLVLEGCLASGGAPEDLVGPLLRTPEVLEQVAMCDQGTMVGFTEDGRVRTAPERMPRWQVAQRDAVQQGVRAFQALWLDAALATGPQGPARAALDLTDPHTRTAALRTLSRLVTRPSAEEALAFGSWLHDDNFGDDASAAIVDPTTLDRARYASPAALAALTMREGFWPVAAARLVDPALGAVAGLVAEGRIDPAGATSPAELGEVVVFVDEGADFAGGARDDVVPGAGPQGRVLVRSSQPVTRAERVRVDLPTRHALVRLDRVTITVHTSGAREPYQLELSGEHLQGEARLLHGARWLAPGVFEVDPEADGVFYAVDLRVLCPPAVARAHQVEVELALAALPLPPGALGIAAPPAPPVEVVEVRVEVPVAPLWERAARRAVREVRGARPR